MRINFSVDEWHKSKIKKNEFTKQILRMLVSFINLTRVKLFCFILIKSKSRDNGAWLFVNLLSPEYWKKSSFSLKTCYYNSSQ